MSAGTSIPWAHHTFNPWHGCVKLSDGCKNCYAAAQDKRGLHGDVSHWGEHAARRMASVATWAEPARWNAAALKAGEPARVFCGSMCDVAEDRFELVEPRRRLVDVIDSTRALRWLLLSKRPFNFGRLFQLNRHATHVWIGASVENQEAADDRIPWIRGALVPCGVRFLSVEPLLARVRLELGGIDWVIVGGESGTAARTCAVDWIVDVVQQCKAQGVPVFVKQLGRRPLTSDAGAPVVLRVKGKGEDAAEWPGWYRESFPDLFGPDGGILREFPRDPAGGAS